MADVILQVGGREYKVGCQAGDEPRLIELGKMIDSKAKDAAAIIGAGASETRQLLFAALLLADALTDAQAGIAPPPVTVAPPAPPHDFIAPALLLPVAERLERLADMLEHQSA